MSASWARSTPKRTGILRAPATPFQVALLDAGMAGLDGLSLARAIKADPAISSTRLILLTSLGQKLNNAEITAAAIAACQTNPVKRSQLFDCLATVMGRAATRAGDLHVRATPISPPPRTLRLLLAEDNAVNQEVATGQFRRLGYHADVASNGLEALGSHQRAPYDAILMDCQMPEMDGYEATRRIRLLERSERRKAVWIIAMTASAMPEEREVCLAAGMNDFIAKPVRDAELQKALDLNLPGMSGCEVLKTIKQDSDLKSIPVVILTSSQAELDVAKSYDLHANCCITKPLDLDRFAAMIKLIEEFWLTVVKLPPHKEDGHAG